MIPRTIPRTLGILPLALLAGCHSHGGATGPTGAAASAAALHQGVGEAEPLRVIGTEPFWGGTVAHGTFTYTTPDNEKGAAIPVSRFAGNNGLGFSGTHGGQELELAVTDAPCSDGMSDRAYPLTLTLLIGGQTRLGCGWTASRAYREQSKP